MDKECPGPKGPTLALRLKANATKDNHPDRKRMYAVLMQNGLQGPEDHRGRQLPAGKATHMAGFSSKNAARLTRQRFRQTQAHAFAMTERQEARQGTGSHPKADHWQAMNCCKVLVGRITDHGY